jgi:LacI family transcriptional regulator
MRDIARELGVSVTTVSRVLAGKAGGISELTALRVRRAADEQGYFPNTVASGFRHHRSGTVGLVLADVGNPFFGNLARAAEIVLSNHGLSMLLANTGNDLNREREAVRLLLEKQVDGLIIASSGGSVDHIQNALARGVKVVLVDTALPISTDMVLVDNETGSQAAIDHLLKLGHEDIAILTGALQASFDLERLSGYHKAYAAFRMTAPAARRFVSDSSFEGGKQATAQVILSQPRPTAIFATNNLMSMGAIVAIAEAGLSLPKDISLVAFDDMELYASGVLGITTVAQPAVELGKVSAERLVAVLRHEANAPRRVVLKTELIVRSSTTRRIVAEKPPRPRAEGRKAKHYEAT